MKKLYYLFLLSLSVFAVSSCDNDDDIMNTKLIKGQWEVVSQDSPDYKYIYDFTTQSEHTWSWGELTTYYISSSGSPVHDKVYDWHVDDPSTSNPVYLEITLKGILDNDDAWTNTDQFIVEKLTPSEMVLRSTHAGDNGRITKLSRRND